MIQLRAGDRVRFTAYFRSLGRLTTPRNVTASTTTLTKVSNRPVDTIALGEYFFEMVVDEGPLTVEFMCATGERSSVKFEVEAAVAREVVMTAPPAPVVADTYESRPNQAELERRRQALRDQWKKPLPNSSKKR